MVDLEILDVKEKRLSVDDIRSIVEIERHPRVREWLYDYISPSAQKEFRDYKDFFGKVPENRKVDVLIARHEGQLVGFLALWRLGAYMGHVASIGISVHPDHWGEGIATELIRSVIGLAKARRLRRLEVEALAENAPIRHVVEKLGFKLECLKKDRVRKGGLYHDEAVYCLFLR